MTTPRDRMNNLAIAAAEGRHDDVLTLARALKRDQIALPSTDPTLLGWARDYELRALYHLRRWNEGLTLLEADETRPYVISAKNAAWMRSAGAEMAAHLGLAESVLDHGQAALSLRLDDGDVDGAVAAIGTTRALLARLDRSDLAERFTTWSERLWVRQEPGARRAIDSAMAVARAAKNDWYLEDLVHAEQRALVWLLRESSLLGDTEGTTRLLAAGAWPDGLDPRAPGLPTALHEAAFRGEVRVVLLLLEAGASTDIANVQGRTPLHMAADRGHTGVVRLLLDARAQIDATDFAGHTPLHIAASQDHLETVQVLAAAGAPLHLGDANGDAPLALAASESATSVLEYLLTIDSRVDRRNHFGQSALHGAAIAGGAPALRLLIRAGADPTLRDHDGLTPLAWANLQGHPEMEAMLGHRP